MPTEVNPLNSVAKPNMPVAEKVLPYLHRIDSSGVYSNMGPLTREFESRIASIIGLSPQNVATCSNATMAITGALSTAFDPGTNINVPSWTFAASPLAIHAAAMIPFFVDVSATSWESQIPMKLEPGLHVLPFGSRGINVAKPQTQSSSVPLVIDAAASFATLENIELPENRDWALILSTHATKTLGSGEGGIVISNNVNWITDFRRWTNFGFWGTRESQVFGTNAKMSEYHAAVGLASLDSWEQTKQKLSALQTVCLSASQEIGIKTQPAMSQGDLSTYWIVQFELPEQKKMVVNLLQNQQIGYRDWWGQGAHEMVAFRNLPRENSLLNTEGLAQTTLGLPFHLNLTSGDVERVARLVSSCL